MLFLSSYTTRQNSGGLGQNALESDVVGCCNFDESKDRYRLVVGHPQLLYGNFASESTVNLVNKPNLRRRVTGIALAIVDNT